MSIGFERSARANNWGGKDENIEMDEWILQERIRFRMTILRRK